MSRIAYKFGCIYTQEEMEEDREALREIVRKRKERASEPGWKHWLRTFGFLRP